MPLLHINDDVSTQPDSLLWTMGASTGATVPVVISFSAIQLVMPGGPFAVFKAHRKMLERIASNKFDRDGLGRNETLVLTQDDLSDPSLL